MNKNDLKFYLDALDIQKTGHTLEFIELLQKKHLSHFSFNNIAVLLGEEISLELNDIFKKIVQENRGGYCFEHNKLFYEVLNELGFDVLFVVGKVLLTNEKIDVAKTHRVTLLSFEDELYLVDVGFGFICPNKPLSISSSTLNNSYIIEKNNDKTLSLRIQTPDGLLTLYMFDLQTYSEADCIMGNFYSSNYKDAAFVNNAVISLQHQDETLSFKNNKYHIIKKNSNEIKEISSSSKLQKLFQDVFSIMLNNEEAQIVFNKGLRIN
ncbi:arylamine N-acetyltransferase [Sulfurimonas sp. SAG-AH-194-C20]|nr:arylamine N-acetyltransferase [Sulfurimonas sp. SAG-AH-194-C20]MDF1878152.1 arylamine N-acetyltransferase [Sulfurimonas sp. SAG-AH-194-C20]